MTTGQRGAILKALAELGEHPSAQEIADKAKRLQSRITLATVYRADSLQLTLVARAVPRTPDA